MYPPEQLRRCREVLEPGRAVWIKVPAKFADGEVRFFGDDAEPLEKALEGAVAALRVHLAPGSVEMDSLRKRLQPAAGAERGGDVVLVAGLGEGREVELDCPRVGMLWGRRCAAP